jgi:hypothetical protein
MYVLAAHDCRGVAAKKKLFQGDKKTTLSLVRFPNFRPQFCKILGSVAYSLAPYCVLNVDSE